MSTLHDDPLRAVNALLSLPRTHGLDVLIGFLQILAVLGLLAALGRGSARGVWWLVWPSWARRACKAYTTHAQAHLPTVSRPGAPTVLLRACEPQKVPACGRCAINVGLRLEGSHELYLRITPIHNPAATVGDGLRVVPAALGLHEEITVVVENWTDEPVDVATGDPIAEAVLERHLSPSELRM